MTEPGAAAKTLPLVSHSVFKELETGSGLVVAAHQGKLDLYLQKQGDIYRTASCRVKSS